MSEYDHMMRGGKTGSGPMADHIQVRVLSSIARDVEIALVFAEHMSPMVLCDVSHVPAVQR